eukprot:440755-Amphidinium_carterae.1
MGSFHAALLQVTIRQCALAMQPERMRDVLRVQSRIPMVMIPRATWDPIKLDYDSSLSSVLRSFTARCRVAIVYVCCRR